MLQKANSRNPKRKVPRRVPAGPLYSGYVALFLYSCREFFRQQAERLSKAEFAKIPPRKNCAGRLRSRSLGRSIATFYWMIFPFSDRMRSVPSCSQT